MENRLPILVFCIVLLSFIGITEMYMLSLDSASSPLEKLSEAEQEEYIEDYNIEYEKIQQEREESWIEFWNGEISIDTLNDRLKAYDNSESEIRQKTMNVLAGRNPDSDLSSSFNAGGFIINILTIQIPDAPMPVNLILSLFNSVLLVVSGMIIASYVYDGIKALPFT